MKNIRYFAIIFLILAYMVYRNITTSIFLINRDKINVVFYGQNIRYYSIDPSDTDYIVSFTPAAQTLVPGGYGNYRLGSIGKLVSLESKPEIFKKTFSLATSSFVDLYFYPTDNKIFYENSTLDNNFPSFKEIFFDKSNANLTDRIFILLNFANKNQNSYRLINTSDYFNSDKFNSDYQGIFYKKTYRQTEDNVQIIYDSDYTTAVLLSNIMDGEGIRVVDISQGKTNGSKCQIVAKKDKVNSATTKGLSRFFNCPVVTGETELSDIILKLGNLEKDWSAK